MASDRAAFELSARVKLQHPFDGDAFNPQPPGEVRFWIRLSLAVISGNVGLDARDVSLRLHEPRLAAAG